MKNSYGIPPDDIVYCQPQLDQGWHVVKIDDLRFRVEFYDDLIDRLGPRVSDDPDGVWEYPIGGFLLFRDLAEAVLFKLSF